MFSSEINRVVSSAKTMGSKTLEMFLTSLMYKINSNGVKRIDPWGTPHIIS